MELRKKQYEKAIEFFTLALQNSTNRIGEKAEIYKSMSEAYQKMENLDLANKYKLLSLEIENEIRNSQLKSNEAILELMVENKTSKQNLSFRNRLILILIGGIILVILIYFLFRTKFNKSIKSLQKRIDEKHQEIETLEQKHLKDHTELLELAQTGNRDFWIQFQIVYPQFKERLIEINPKLTNSELTLAAYIVLGFNTREIADVTFRAYKTVETTRYNLRKKLNLSAETRVDEYLKEVLK